MSALIEEKRRAYEKHQPVFWRRAPDSEGRTVRFFEAAVAGDQHLSFVFESDRVIQGFLIGALIKAPPVYDPGGLTCMIDDFMVADPSLWGTVDSALLATARAAAKERGAAQTVIVCGHHDHAKSDFLGSAGVSIASNWWVGEIP